MQAVPMPGASVQAAPGVAVPAGQAPGLQTQPAPGQNGVPPTYAPEGSGQYQEQHPIPDRNFNGASGTSPRLIDPDSRTTLGRPNFQTAIYPDRPVSRPAPSANLVVPAVHVQPKAIDDGGWRAARR
jgi:hypothetical protein